jgi:ketosteroid isomerase-like protein
MHPHAQLIQSFYQAFSRHDGEAMAACYHPEARFSDPVFPDLSAEQVGNMWRMFCSGAANTKLDVTFRDVRGDDASGSAHWDARYNFGSRPVLNSIDASFQFKDGKIYRHTDRFDFYKWTRMALGPAGLLLGWTPMVQNKVRKQARARLDEFSAKRGGR